MAQQHYRKQELQAFMRERRQRKGLRSAFSERQAEAAMRQRSLRKAAPTPRTSDGENPLYRPSPGRRYAGRKEGAVKEPKASAKEIALGARRRPARDRRRGHARRGDGGVGGRELAAGPSDAKRFALRRQERAVRAAHEKAKKAREDRENVNLPTRRVLSLEKFGAYGRQTSVSYATDETPKAAPKKAAAKKPSPPAAKPAQPPAAACRTAPPRLGGARPATVVVGRAPRERGLYGPVKNVCRIIETNIE